jgi:hypothetical protein
VPLTLNLSRSFTSSFCSTLGHNPYFKLAPVNGGGVLFLQLSASSSIPADSWSVVADVLYTTGTAVRLNITQLPQVDSVAADHAVPLAAGNYVIALRIANIGSATIPPFNYTITPSWLLCTLDATTNDVQATAVPLEMNVPGTFSVCPIGDIDW